MFGLGLGLIILGNLSWVLLHGNNSRNNKHFLTYVQIRVSNLI